MNIEPEKYYKLRTNGVIKTNVWVNDLKKLIWCQHYDVFGNVNKVAYHVTGCTNDNIMSFVISWSDVTGEISKRKFIELTTKYLKNSSDKINI